MSATPSKEAMGIGRDFVRRGLMWREHDLASAIDALVARRVEEERERCAKVCDEAARNRWNQHDDEFMQKTTVFAQRSGSHPTTVRYAASLLAAAIRATPPKG